MGNQPLSDKRQIWAERKPAFGSPKRSATILQGHAGYDKHDSHVHDVRLGRAGDE